MKLITSRRSLRPFGWCFVLLLVSTQSWGQSRQRCTGCSDHTFLNGDRYVGEWEAGEFEGEGTYTRATAGRHFGEDIDDVTRKYAMESKTLVAARDKGKVEDGKDEEGKEGKEGDRPKKNFG